MLSVNRRNCHVTQKIGVRLRTVERCSIDRTRLIELLGAVTCQGTWADKQWGKDRCSGITLQVKRRSQLIVRLKATKSRKDTFRYLSSYLHHSFLWHLVIITFIYYIIKSSAKAKTLGRIKNVRSYRCTIGSSASHWVVAEKSRE